MTDYSGVDHMERQPKDMANLGPFGVVRETWSLFRRYPKFLFAVQFTLVLPSSIILYGLQFALSHLRPDIPPGLPSRRGVPTGAGYAPQHPGFSNAKASGTVNDRLLPVLEYLAAAIGNILVSQALQALCITALLYAVGLIYTGRRISFLDVLHQIPRLWKRVMVTSLVYILLFFCILFATFALIFGLVAMHAVQWIILATVPLAVSMLLLDIIFQIADGVSVLEEDYGWAAFKKSVKLLSKRRIWVAVGVTLLLIIPLGVPQYFLISWTDTAKISAGMESSNLLLTLLAVVLCFVWVSLMTEFSFLAGGVMYVSFKAYHNESIADSSFLNDLTKDKDEYKSFATGSTIDP